MADYRLPDATHLGFAHLRVTNLARSLVFYRDLLGFSVTQRGYPGALFVSAGGYHHHVGLNIWAGRGAPPAPPDTVGLIAFSVRLPDVDAWQAAVQRVRDARLPLEDVTASGVLVRDPSRNGVLLQVC